MVEPRYFRSGDTLIIQGFDPRAPVDSATYAIRSLNVYGLKGGTVELAYGNSYIEGDSTTGGSDYRFMLKQDRLEIGQAGDTGVPENISHIRGLTVTGSDNSNIELNPGVRIDDLRVELDSLSSFSETDGWDIGKIHVQADGQARLTLSGSLWNKIMMDASVK